MLEQYEGLRTEVLNLVSSFEGSLLAERIGEHHRLVDDAAVRLRERTLRIVVCAEWNNGKSTLLNAMLGVELLPTSVRECTAAITSIEWAEQPRLSKRVGGAVEVVAEGRAQIRSALPKLVTAGVGSGSSRTEFVVGFPLELCRRGAVLVDTPGVESLSKPREDVTYREIPRADAVLFILDASKAGTQGDIGFLEALSKTSVERIFFVLNRIDELRSEGEEEAAVEGLMTAMASVPKEVRVGRDRVLRCSALEALLARELRAGDRTLEGLASDRRFRWRVEGRPLNEVLEDLDRTSRFAEFEGALTSFLLSDESTRALLTSPCKILDRTLEQEIESPLSLLLKELESPEKLARLRQRLASAEAALGRAPVLQQEACDEVKRFKDGLWGTWTRGDGPLSNRSKEKISRALTDLITNKDRAALVRNECALLKRSIRSLVEAAHADAEALRADALRELAGELDRRVREFKQSVSLTEAPASALGEQAALAPDYFGGKAEDVAIVGGGSAVIGGAIGATITGLASGGLGAPAGAAIGAAIGGLVGLLSLRWMKASKLKEQVDKNIARLFKALRSGFEDTLDSDEKRLDGWVSATFGAIRSEAKARVVEVRAALDGEHRKLEELRSTYQAALTEAGEWRERIQTLHKRIELVTSGGLDGSHVDD